MDGWLNWINEIIVKQICNGWVHFHFWTMVEINNQAFELKLNHLIMSAMKYREE